ncbi:MAG TPA: MaoC family dehydratase [Rhizomicrobium sp.]|jgi:acyl dehydratase|nr:MaoC family dehydratase [Rhizomicrobium sp.]
MKHVTFEELPGLVGQETGVSDWVTIDQDRIDKFADATGDHQWIHVDVERAAREMPGGKTIAHGYLTLSLIPWLTGDFLKVEGVTRGINYGANKTRFTNMVPVGSRVRARSRLLAVEPRGGGMQLTSEITIEIEGQKRPALVTESIGILFK